MRNLVDDFLKEIDAKRTEQIKRTGESHSESTIYCPYCAREQRDHWECGIVPNEEENEVQCQSCERYFMVSAEVRYSTRRLK